MLEFKKINKDSHEIYDGEVLVGIIKCDRTEFSIRGYQIGFYQEVLGYSFGGYTNNLKQAKALSIIKYKKMLDCISKRCGYYAPEILMYFDTEQRYLGFKETSVYKRRYEKAQNGTII